MASKDSEVDVDKEEVGPVRALLRGPVGTFLRVLGVLSGLCKYSLCG